MLLVIPYAFLKSRLKESFLAIILLGKWQVIISSELWREPCFEFKIEGREVWKKSDS